MQDFKIFSLGDVANIQTGPFGSQLHKKDYADFGTPIVTVEHLGNRNFAENNLPLVSDSDKERLKKFVLCEGDIVFSRVGSVDRCSYVSKNYAGWLFSGRCLRVRANEKIYPLFLYYFFCLKSTKQNIINISVGTTMPSLNTKLLGEIEVKVPPLEVQKKIAAVLSSLDDKIELNNKININLEQQAQAIFKNFFITNFNPAWKEIYLSEIADFVGGYSYKGNELKNSDTAMVTIKNFNRNGGFKIEGLKEIQPSAKLKIEHDIKLFDVVVAHTDLTQNAEIVGNAENILSFGGYKKLIFSMDVVKVVPKNDNVSKFLLGEILKTKKFKNHCLEYVNGTTVLHLSKKALPEYKLFFPTDFSVLNKINKIFSSIFETISTNLDENKRLAEMRDLLLPRLLNGEIDVSKVEI